MYSSYGNALLHYKAFLKNDDGSNIEIRRFDIHYKRTSHFEDTCKKLKDIFPEIRDNKFTVSWIDEEGDEIRITSNEELETAIEIAERSAKAMNSPIHRATIKLHIKLDQKDKNARCFQREAIIHGNVICDGCDNVISGFRYKCMTCEDYDLCSQCEILGLHAEHCMLRMLQPLNWSTHSGKRLLDHIKKFLRRKGLDYCNRESSGYETKKEKQPDGNVAATSENTVQESPKRNTKLIDLTVIEPPPMSDQTIVSHSSTASAVNPLMEEWTILDKDDSRASSVSSNLDEPTENNAKAAAAPAAISVATSTAISEATAQSTTTPMAMSMYTLEITSATTPATAVFTSATAPGTSVFTPVVTSVSTSVSKSSTTSSTASSTASATASATAPIRNSPRSIYPELPKESRIYHPNPVIHNALLALITMGYSNNVGVLTHLLETENGDINRVLDILEYGKR